MREKPYQTNWTKVDAIKDKDIDYSYIPEVTDEQFQNATFVTGNKLSLKTSFLR